MKSTVNSTNLRRDVLIGLGITLVLFAVAEAGLRIYWKVKWPQDPRYWQFHEQAGFKYVPGKYSVEKSLVGFEGNVNSLGYRGPEWKKEKEPGVTRIVCLGDSVVLGLRGTTPDASFPRQLEILLNENKRGSVKRFEVLNGGLGSNTSSQALYRLKTEFLDYRADLVIVQVGFNDMNESNPMVPASYRPGGWIKSVCQRSFLVRTLAGVIFKVVIPKMHLSPEQAEKRREKFENYTPEPFRSNMMEISKICRERNIRAVFITLSLRLNTEDADRHPQRQDHPPYFARDLSLYKTLVRRYNETIQGIGKEMSVPVADMAGFWERVPQGSRYFNDFVHFNDEGYSLYGRELLKKLERHNLP